MENLENLNVDPDLDEHLNNIEKSFKVERDIKSGLMLAHDEEVIAKMSETRRDGLELLSDIGLIDDVLAFEKVFTNGIGEYDKFVPYRDNNIKRLDRIIESFNFIREDGGKEYKAKVEEMQAKGEWAAGPKGLPIDDCHKDLSNHIGYLQNGFEGTREVIEPGSQMEHHTYCERLVMANRLVVDYEDIQSKVLGIEKGLGQTKEAGVELAP